MSESRRVLRVEKELRQIIGPLLLQKYQSEMTGLLTVTRVRVSPDLRSAKVFIGFMQSEDDQIESVLSMLKSEAGEIQRVVHKQLPMKFCPKITFLRDENLDHAMKIDSILNDIKSDSDGDENQ